MRQGILNVFHSFLDVAKKRGYKNPYAIALDNTSMELEIDHDRIRNALCRANSIDNRQRELWIDNDEGLYNAWMQSRLSKRDFIKSNKVWLDDVILAVIL